MMMLFQILTPLNLIVLAVVLQKGSDECSSQGYGGGLDTPELDVRTDVVAPVPDLEAVPEAEPVPESERAAEDVSNIFFFFFFYKFLYFTDARRLKKGGFNRKPASLWYIIYITQRYILIT